MLKFFLHISPEEQKERLLARLDEPDKRWKFNPRDVEERALWPAYQAAYEEMLSRTSEAYAPWYIIPADHKWFSRLAVAAITVQAIDDLKLSFPKVSPDKKRELQEVRKALAAEKD